MEPVGAALPPATPPPRPHPQLDQLKRRWYFFRRNGLALGGLIVLILIAGVAVYGLFQPLSWYTMKPYCLADYGPGSSEPIAGDTGSGWWHYNETIHHWQGNGPFNDSAILDCNAICTYEVVPPPNASNWCGGVWYKTPTTGSGLNVVSYPALLGPTLNLATLTPGAAPLGVLSLGIGQPSPVYNIATGLVRGADWSLGFSVGIVGMGAVLGLVVGALAGYLGGTVDDVLMRLTDVFLSIPAILFVIVLISAISTTDTKGILGLGPINTPLFLLVIAFGIVWWPLYARIVRSQVLVTREQKYVEAARASGASQSRILRRHIIPNSVQPIFIQFSLDVGTIPLLIGSLQYLGFGRFIFPPISNGAFPEWGTISAIAVQGLPSALNTCLNGTCLLPWWELLFPGLALFCYAISVNFLADGLRDALDPRLLR